MAEILQKPIELLVKEIEDSIAIARYKEQMKNHVPSEEEIWEMQAAFGKGTKVINVITGQEYNL